MATVGHNRKMLGAECMADMLEAYGVTHVFHVPAVLRKTFAVMETRTKIKRLHVHSEATAAYMPDRVERTRTLYLDGGDGHVIADLRYRDFGPAAKVIEWGIAVHQGQQFGLAECSRPQGE